MRPNTAMLVRAASNTMTVFPLRYENKPLERWVIDPSIFPDTKDYSETFVLSSKGVPPSVGHSSEVPSSANETVIDSARKDFESDLFSAPTGHTIYVEPKLMTGAQDASQQTDDAIERVTIQQIVEDSNSYIVESRSEYGGTSLCKRLHYELLAAGNRAYLRDANTLPNYRKKIEGAFPSDAALGSTLILDNFDADRHERLLGELWGTGWFNRLIIVVTARTIRPVKPIIAPTSNISFKKVHLWPISRSDIRSIASVVFQTDDGPFISSAVDKTYSDLLALCIPLTAANVVMYLRIMLREGDFHPLNRVDIVGR
ncbi:MAG TPA: hypothetical protein VFO86_04400, partial [Terriglobia bacterium]|nr:hypothetical protein [Terriglobia bacterium]